MLEHLQYHCSTWDAAFLFAFILWLKSFQDRGAFFMQGKLIKNSVARGMWIAGFL